MGLRATLKQLLSLAGFGQVGGTPSTPSPATITFSVSETPPSERRDASVR